MAMRLWPAEVNKFLVSNDEFVTFDNMLTYTVYDLVANRRTVKIRAHDNDVNSCCWADTASGNVLISASDDTFLKVWYVLFREKATEVHVHQGSTFTGFIPEAFWCLSWTYGGPNLRISEGRRSLRHFQW